MIRSRTLTLLLIAVLAAASAVGQVGTNSAVLNPNLAGAEEMAAVPHVDAALARAIIDGRPYLSMTDFEAILARNSLSEEQRAEVYTRLFVPINLNTAPEMELLMVPGAGPRMAHEFDEYRPYDGGLVEFRREIGKYVDDDEVARLEQFVFVPLDLNTASRDDILTIPGVGDRMAHEFEEYRPYRSIAQFRREIGKDVDDNEVARLERYVVIR